MKRTEKPFPEAAFKYLASAESSHWWFRARNSVIIWILRSSVYGIRSFLEVGCGTGFVISGIARAFPLLELEASEYFEDGLVFARQRLPQCRFRQLDATSMAEDNAYDCIGSFDVIEHIEADECVLSNFYRALRSGGFLLLTVPQHPGCGLQQTTTPTTYADTHLRSCAEKFSVQDFELSTVPRLSACCCR